MNLDSGEFKLLEQWFLSYFRTKEFGLTEYLSDFYLMVNPEPIMRKLLDSKLTQNNIKLDDIHKTIMDSLPKYIEQPRGHVAYDAVLYIATPEDLMDLTHKLVALIGGSKL